MVELIKDEPDLCLVRYTLPDERDAALAAAFGRAPAGIAPTDIDVLNLPITPAQCSTPTGFCLYCSQPGYLGWRLKEQTNG